jgi:predicted P-loop ATPase
MDGTVDTVMDTAGAVGVSTAGETSDANSTSPTVPALPRTRPPEEAAWRRALSEDKRGTLKTTYANVVGLLRNDRAFGRFRFNERTLQPEFNGFAIDEGLMLRLAEAIELRWSVTPGYDMFVRAVMCVARERPYDPVRDELEQLGWDGVPRLDSVASRFLGNDGALEAVLIRKTIIAAVARALDPGCQVDTTCVLTGGQGALKSSFWRAFAGPENFGDSALDITNKDAPLQMRASWFYELPEIDGITTRRHADQVKAFMTVRSDLFRPPYGRAVARYPRATILVGSTNRDDYLTDPTGSRRFWTVEVNRESGRRGQKINVDALAAERDQLLAEAVAAYKAWSARGRPRSESLWWLTASEDRALAEQSLQHQESDPWESAIEKWLSVQAGPRDVLEILTGALQLEKAKATRADQTRVGRIMHGLGYVVERRREGESRRRVYVKPEPVYAPGAQDAPSGDQDAPTDDADVEPDGEGLDSGPTWSNRANTEHVQVGPLSPHSRPGWSNWSNRSNLFPHVGAHTRALTRASAPICVGPVGPVGPDSKLGRESGPTSDGQVGPDASLLDQPASEPASRSARRAVPDHVRPPSEPRAAGRNASDDASACVLNDLHDEESR